LEFKTTENKTTSLDVPRDAKIFSGFCGNTNQSIVLSWKALDLNLSVEYYLAVNFSIGSSDKTHYYISEFHLSTFPSNKSGDSGPLFEVQTVGDFYETQLNRSFICSSEQKINGNLTVLSAGLRYEAFRPTNIKKDVFNDGDVCQADKPKPPKSKGSSVGAILGSITVVLIGLALGTYLGIRYGLIHKLRTCCRRREEGYQSLHADT